MNDFRWPWKGDCQRLSKYVFVVLVVQEFFCHSPDSILPILSSLVASVRGSLEVTLNEATVGYDPTHVGNTFRRFYLDSQSSRTKIHGGITVKVPHMELSTRTRGVESSSHLGRPDCRPSYFAQSFRNLT